ncbi:MAG TPA: molybdopterin-binding protein [Nitrospiria bacterium]|nr:molybdopterin-binding protein [Nitrospiria bacterium]
MSTRAEILIIGNEILSGKVADEHAAFLCREFRALGVDVRRVVVLPDDVDVIAEAVRAAWARADLIVTTGGVGPTHDDVTIEGVAKGLGRPLVRHPVLFGLVQELYGASGDPYVNRLADVPEGATLITAEGLRVPVVSVDKLYVFPGVPEVFRRKFNAIKSRFRSSPFHLRTIYLGVGEESIASLLYDAAARYPDLALGSYPVVGRNSYRVRLTLESKDPTCLESAFAFLTERLPNGSVVAVDREP